MYFSSYWNSLSSLAVFYSICIVYILHWQIVHSFRFQTQFFIYLFNFIFNILETIGMEEPAEEDNEGIW